MKLHTCLLTDNDCYRAGVRMVPRGVMVHSTGANNPNLRRYVQPDDGLLGKNTYHNDWNRKGVGACVHAFVGRLADGSVASYQTLPWDMRGWHCGRSGNDTHIAFEICEDGLEDTAYFEQVYREAVELTAYLCGLYGLDPLGDGIVLSHSEGSRRGIASDHSDVEHWFSRFGRTMDDFRRDVKEEMEKDMTQQDFDDMMNVWLEKPENREKIAACAPCGGATSGGAAGDEAEKSRYYKKDGIHFVDIAPGKFHIRVWNQPKKTTEIRDYFNLGFFGILKGGATIPVGNLCADGEVITEASNQESWLSSHGRKMTTLCVFDDGTVKVMKTDTISGLKGLQSAVSGIPVVLGGEDVSWSKDCKPEGYTGGECYATWHGFLGSLRDGSLKYFAMKTKTGNCIQSSEVWNKIRGYGFDDVIMLDGGGSFVLDNGGRNVAVTSENRRIHSVGLY